LFTICAAARYDRAMLLFAAAALAASTPHAATMPMVQARATVRIIAGVRLRFRETKNADAPVARDTLVRTESGTQPAKLIEFE
jgi:hypothetical protein